MKNMLIGVTCGALYAGLKNLKSVGTEYVSLTVSDKKGTITSGEKTMPCSIIILSEASATAGVEIECKANIKTYVLEGGKVNCTADDPAGESVVFSFNELMEFASVLADNDTAVMLNINSERHTCSATFGTKENPVSMSLPLKEAKDVKMLPKLEGEAKASLKVKASVIKAMATAIKATITRGDSAEIVAVNCYGDKPKYVITGGTAGAIGEIGYEAYNKSSADENICMPAELVRNLSGLAAGTVVEITLFDKLVVASYEENGLSSRFLNPLATGAKADGLYQNLEAKSTAKVNVSFERETFVKAVKLLNIGKDNDTKLTIELSNGKIILSKTNANDKFVIGSCDEKVTFKTAFNDARALNIINSLYLKKDDNGVEEPLTMGINTVFSWKNGNGSIVLAPLLDKENVALTVAE